MEKREILDPFPPSHPTLDFRYDVMFYKAYKK